MTDFIIQATESSTCTGIFFFESYFPTLLFYFYFLYFEFFVSMKKINLMMKYCADTFSRFSFDE
jgi:hypothetical protein